VLFQSLAQVERLRLGVRCVQVFQNRHYSSPPFGHVAGGTPITTGDQLSGGAKLSHGISRTCLLVPIELRTASASVPFASCWCRVVPNTISMQYPAVVCHVLTLTSSNTGSILCSQPCAASGLSPRIDTQQIGCCGLQGSLGRRAHGLPLLGGHRLAPRACRGRGSLRSSRTSQSRKRIRCLAYHPLLLAGWFSVLKAETLACCCGAALPILPLCDMLRTLCEQRGGGKSAPSVITCGQC